MDNISFAQLAERYFTFITNRDRRPATLGSYRSNLNVILRSVPALNAAPLDSDLVEVFVGKRRAEGKSAANINQNLRTMRAILNFGRKRKLCLGDVEFVFLKMPKRHKMLSEDELVKVLEVAKAQDLGVYNVLRFASFTGCRKTELLTRLWADVNFDERTLLIGARGSFQTKSGDDRVMPLTSSAIEWLRTLRESQEHNSDQDPILQKADGCPWGSHLARQLQHVFELAGVEKIRLHGLRHLFVTKLLERGAPVHSVQALAGHKSLTTTMGHYAHVRNKALREAIDLMEDG